MPPLVLYHANCPDGFCAAWVARLASPAAECIPVNYGEPPPYVGHRDVYIVDFSYPRKTLMRMAEDADSITVLDHHKTAQADLAAQVAENVSVTFDMDKSGGRLTWEHFNGTEKPSPWLVDYTEDRDLWRWKLPKSRELNAVIASHPHDFTLWNHWAGIGTGVEQVLHKFVTGQSYATSLFRGLVAEGEAILRYQAQQVASICASARECEIHGHKILAANTPVLISEVAGKLAEGRPFGATYFTRSDGKKQWSLRSRDGGVDVSEIAKANGGGGHRNAAGFEE